MATSTIVQRTRENQVVKTYNITTNNVSDGMTYDGEFFWLCSAAGTLTQVDLPSATVVREFTGITSGGAGIIGLAFDGNTFWPVYDKFTYGIGAVTPEGVQLLPVGGITTYILQGVAMDGEYILVHGVDPFGGGGSTLHQVDHSSGGFLIVKSYTLAAQHNGLVCDGEFLICGVTGAAFSRDLYFYTREGNLVKTAGGEATNGTEKYGMAFDGEFIYTLLSS